MVSVSDIQVAVEEYTGLSWSVEVDSGDRVVLSRSSLLYEFEKVGDESWELRLYNEREGEEPLDVVSPVVGNEVVSEVERFTPQGWRRR